MRRTVRVLSALLALTSFAGCSLGLQRTLDDPDRNQTLRVESGERLYFVLDADARAGCRWKADCADSDVLVKIAPADATGKTKVEIRIHRGYDGPSEVRFRCMRPGVKTPVKEFTLALFRRTGDCAFWK